jgi:hypothetical protein
MASAERLLSELENSRYRFGRAQAARILQLLQKARATRFDDVASLIRLHEALLVLRAFPPSAAVLRASVQLLDSFWKRVERLREKGADMDDFDPLEVSGIAGTVMQDAIGFDLARWLVERMPGKVEIAWDDFDDERAMGVVWPRFLPLLNEDAAVEAEIPWRKWLEMAQGNRRTSPEWLIGRFDALPLPASEKARLYESLHMPIRWRLENSRVSRTRNSRPVQNVFFHAEPLLTRKDVSLDAELRRKPPRLVPLPVKQGRTVTDLIREVMLVRYRELYGTTLGDPNSVVRAHVGRGVTIYLWGLPPDRRLPLRAYIAGVTLKNGVPINYIEAIGLFEWMEIGFNTFYTYRGGEVAWIFAQVLRCLTARMGTTCVSMYPYQLGHKNEEAIESGAFWFYRKLGFRPGRADLLKLVEREEKRIASNPEYKTPARTLRRLSEGHAFYELPGNQATAWDRFSTRNIGLRVNRAMAKEFAGDAQRFKAAAAAKLAKTLRTRIPAAGTPAHDAFHDFALVAWLIPKLSSGTAEQKDLLRKIILAKAGRDEMQYLNLLQKHPALRKAILKLGSRSWAASASSA